MTELEELINEKADIYSEGFRCKAETCGWKEDKSDSFIAGFNAADAEGFAEWAYINWWRYTGGSEWRNSEKMETRTTKQLYTQYLNSK